MLLIPGSRVSGHSFLDIGSERTKVRKVSQRLLSVRRALNLQDRDFYRLQNRPLSSVTSCDKKAEKFSAYHVKKPDLTFVSKIPGIYETFRSFVRFDRISSGFEKESGHGMNNENSRTYRSRNLCSKPSSHSRLPRGFLRSRCRSDTPRHTIRMCARAASAAMSRQRRGKIAIQPLVYMASRETSQVFAPLLHKPRLGTSEDIVARTYCFLAS
jgi:hypothetical protein